MSKINVEFDTQTKLMSAKLDGKEVGNLSSIVFYCGQDKDGNTLGAIELSTFEVDEDNKTYKHTRVSAEDQNELVDKEIPVHEEIAALLKKF